MYKTTMPDGRQLHFPNAPPLRVGDPVYDSGPAAPYQGAPGYTCSVYYFWWEFLHLSQIYSDYSVSGKSAGKYPSALYKDNRVDHLYFVFGDLGCDFLSWWDRRGANIFSFKYSTLDKPEIVNIVREHTANPKRVIIDVPLDIAEEDVLAEIKTILRKKSVEYEQQNVRAWFPQLYAVQRHELRTLYEVLQTYKIKVANPDLNLSKIYDLAGLQNRKKWDPFTNISIAKANVVFKNLKKADALIFNVEHASFPNFKPPSDNMFDLALLWRDARAGLNRWRHPSH